MARSKIIAVGVDGSDVSRAAVEWAIAEALRRGWGLHMVCSYYLPSYAGASLEGAYVAVDDGHLREEAETIVEAALARARDAGIEATSQLDAGDPMHVLVEVSREVSMLVIGTRGGGSFTDRLLGTVSSSVPSHSHCPTVVVPIAGDNRPFLPIKRIVTGVDGSQSARLALQHAVDEAEAWDAELTAVAAVPIPTGIGMGWVPEAIDRREVIQDVQNALEKGVDEAVAGRDVRTKRHALDGNAAALMAEFSTAVELIVVGTRGRGGFRGLLLGSTSQAVLHYAACPVMVVPNRLAKEEHGFNPTDVPWAS